MKWTSTKRTRLRLVPAVAAAVFLFGCQDLNLKTRDDLRNGDKAPAPAASAGKPVEVQTPPPDRQEEFDAQMRQLNGRVDEVENQANQTNAVIQNIKDENNKTNQTQDQKIAALDEAVKKLQADLQALVEQVNKKPPVPPDPDALVKEAEGLEAAKKDKEAIVVFQKYRDTYPKGPRYGEVTYKIGTCFQDLGMKDEAKAFYDEVISKFPKSKDARAAAKRLKALK